MTNEYHQKKLLEYAASKIQELETSVDDLKIIDEGAKEVMDILNGGED